MTPPAYSAVLITECSSGIGRACALLLARAVHHALSARKPKARYPVGGDCWLGLAISRLPDGLRDALIRRKYGE